MSEYFEAGQDLVVAVVVAVVVVAAVVVAALGGGAADHPAGDFRRWSLAGKC